MALSQIVRLECTVCKKVAVEESSMKVGKTSLIRLACGHMISSEDLTSSDENTYENLIFSDGCRPRHYQIDGIKFGETSNVRFILADEQGLGKTIQALCLLKLHP